MGRIIGPESGVHLRLELGRCNYRCLFWKASVLITSTRSRRSSIIDVHIVHEVRTITLNQGQDLDWRLDEGLYSM